MWQRPSFSSSNGMMLKRGRVRPKGRLLRFPRARRPVRRGYQRGCVDVGSGGATAARGRQGFPPRNTPRCPPESLRLLDLQHPSLSRRYEPRSRDDCHSSTALTRTVRTVTPTVHNGFPALSVMACVSASSTPRYLTHVDQVSPRPATHPPRRTERGRGRGTALPAPQWISSPGWICSPTSPRRLVPVRRVKPVREHVSPGGEASLLRELECDHRSNEIATVRREATALDPV